MKAKTTQKIMDAVFKSCGIVTIMILVLIITYILINGVYVLSPEFIFTNPAESGKDGGILPMILSSIYMVAIALIIAVPIGVIGAVYVCEYAQNRKLIKIMNFTCQTLASVPSIVFGLFGLAFFICYLKLDWSILTAGLVLALMSIPTIYQVSGISIKSVPLSQTQASLALGASKSQTIFKIILPQALSGIYTGVILALTRSISEAAAIMYVVGASLTAPISIFDAGRPLALHLYLLASEGISMENAYGTAAVLVIMILTITVLSNIAIGKYENRLRGV